MSITLDAEFCIEGLEEEALARHGKPATFNPDKGSQVTSTAFTAVLLREKMAIKYGELYLNAYASVPEARASIGRYFAFYNAVRPHSAHGGRTPDQIYFHQPLLAAA
ncbi:transposase [Sphingomonas sp. BT553]|uniref:Transposase n=1 Tax=Sphingomonas mollis TaxID=2795726 RepID=A0ABS0XSI3_9SPHN|nr:transposase [Sphingomonas sp. BT553]